MALKAKDFNDHPPQRVGPAPPHPNVAGMSAVAELVSNQL
jgi:hypothetical protein